MRAVLICNPASGGGTDGAALMALLAARGVEPAGVFSLQEIAAVERAQPDRVVVAGGDGSIGPAADAAARLGVALAVLPVGTANDFARAHGLPRTLGAALDLAAAGTGVVLTELGRLASGRPFVNTAGAGLAAVAAEHARPLKPRLGALAYGAGAVRAAAGAPPIACVVRADGETVYEGDAWQVIVGVTGAFGGGSSLGVADHADGRLDVAVLPAGPRLDLARRGVGLRRGTITEQSGVAFARGRVVELELPPGTDLNVDGEVVRAAEPERATAFPDAFGLVVGR